MAVESPNVTADVIEASEFPELIQRYGVRGVPKTVINATVGIEGAVPEPAFVNRVVQAAREGEE
jgi:predicted DsbA family dithiol-disulfide isomerase